MPDSDPLHGVLDRLPGGMLRRAIRNVHRRSTRFPDQHWTIERFASEPQSPWIAGSHTSAVGTRTRPQHFRFADGGPTEVDSTIPLDDEYYEWTDIFEAVLDAGDTFTFVDLGAGYGRWTSRAAAAARIAGKRFRCAIAEAEPQHLVWLREHMADNGVCDPHIVEAAVGVSRQTAGMTVARPNEASLGEKWYGQSIGWDVTPQLPVVADYFGRPVFEADNGWRFIHVDQVLISDVLAPFAFVDLVDMDIQGMEGPAVEASLETLTAKARRLHIETHARSVEVDLRSMLGGAGWRCLRDHLCGQVNDTPFGRFHMDGGVQTWINPRLL